MVLAKLFHRPRRFLVVGLILSLGLALVSPLESVSAATPPGGAVSDDPITRHQLLSGQVAAGLTANHRFAPSADAGPARQGITGTLSLVGASIEVVSDADGGGISNPVLDKDTTFFPDVSISFFSTDGVLVPTTQDVIRNGVLPDTRSFWDVIVQPGRVWSEPGDGGWNRASFPFALVNSIEGETHMGVALFLYRNSAVSPVRFQIVQMTSPFYVPEYFSGWGTTEAVFEAGGISQLTQRIKAFHRETRARLPVREWSELAVSQTTLDAFTSYSDVFQSAVVQDGVLYRTDCPTAAGPFPYCDAVRYGVWSVTKSSMLNVALLRLAQKYGPEFIDEPISTYVPAAVSNGWQEVTFRNLAMMASGHGPEGAPTCYLCDYDRWYVALSETDKTAEALDYPGLFAAPGTVLNYRDQDAYLLGVALDEFVKAKEGANASVWELLRREVYRPLGIFHAPTNSTVESDGSVGQPLMAYGHYATLDDLAKIALLYQQGGVWRGRQLLQPDLVAQILPKSNPPLGALDSSGDGTTYYYLDWWHQRLESDEGCTVYVPQMQGWGGMTVTLLPGGPVLLRMRNLWVDTPDPQDTINALGDELVDMCS